MKTLIAALLIVAANNAAAVGFSPWSEIAAPDATNAAVTRAETVEAGFGPWRERHVVDEIRIRSERGVIVDLGRENVFRPWS